MSRCEENAIPLKPNASTLAKSKLLESFELEKMCCVAYSNHPTAFIVPILFACIFVTGTIANGSLVFIYIKDKYPKHVSAMLDRTLNTLKYC